MIVIPLLTLSIITDIQVRSAIIYPVGCRQHNAVPAAPAWSVVQIRHGSTSCHILSNHGYQMVPGQITSPPHATRASPLGFSYWPQIYIYMSHHKSCKQWPNHGSKVGRPRNVRIAQHSTHYLNSIKSHQIQNQMKCHKIGQKLSDV